MTQRHRFLELLLPAGILFCLLVVVMPLPSALMDLFLLGNIALSVIILLTTIHIAMPLEFSVFPTVLLATTLARLVLNVATTRLILTRAGEEGLDAAGTVVRSFGEFVAGDQVLVGVVLFGIIAVIQFVVITKGATRISEVSARFALDGLPGKQMAVDAELNSGAIDEAEARRRRSDISRQADFYAAMDGASKFVRGDAVASVFITVINIVGGLILGVGQYGMSFSEAVNVFTKLTIGDGLVSQLPAVLISLAAALLVTRGTQASNLPMDFLRQMLLKPQVLGVAGGFLGLLMLTHLPRLPLLMLGSACVGAAVFLSRQPEPVAAKPTPGTRRNTATPPAEPRIEEYLSVDPVEVELGLALVRLADASRGGNLLARITQLRQAIATELGLVLPKVRIRDNLRLTENQYRIKVLGNPIASATLPTDGVLAVPPSATAPRWEHPVTRHPAFVANLVTIPHAQVAEAERAGYTLLDPAAVLLQHLRQVVSRQAAELLTRDATKHLVEETRRTAPAVVDELIPQVMKLADVQRILQRLLAEGVSIRALSTILEALGDEAGRVVGDLQLTERIRLRLARSICAQYRDERERLHVVTLEPALEERILAQTQLVSGDAVVRLSSQEIENLCRTIDASLTPLRQMSRPEVLLVKPEIRAALRRLVAPWLPLLVVLSYPEITPETKVVSLGIVGDTKTG
jgi:flagellar biosynthesis protein FlhA